MGTTGFALTPHKLSMCILLQAYALPSSSSPPFPHLPVSTRHRFSLFVLQMLKAHDDFLEPSFDELGIQLKLVLGDGGSLLVDHLANRLISILSPEDLCTFALGLRELLATGMNAAPEAAINEEEPLLIDSNSLLGQLLRRCILAFNILSFEGTCKLLTDLDLYRQPMLTTAAGDHTLQNSGSKSMDYVPICDEDLPITEEHYFEHQNLEMERNILNVQEQGKADCEQMSFQDSFINKGESFYGEVNSQSKVHGGRFTFTLSDSDNKVQSPREGLFLCTNDHVDCFIRGLADVIEREVGLFTPDEVALKLSQLEKLAPDTFKVHYLKYLNSLSNGDYPAALDSLHRYFDYSAGKRALNSSTGAGAISGRSQAGLLALGSMHARFGHTSQALQSLYEAVGIAQQSNDDACLAHALAALCHLISEVGAPSDAEASELSLPGLNVGNGPSLSVQEQLLLLLNCCLRRAMELKLPHLMAFSQLVLAKFNLKFVRRSLSSWPTAEHLATSPLDVYKTLRLNPYLLSSITASSFTSSAANLGVKAMLSPGGTSSGSVNKQGPDMLGSSGSSGIKRSLLYARTDPVLGSVLQLAGTAHLLRAASWELYGSAPMARVSALIHAMCYGDVASADDSSLAYVKLAQYLAAHKSYKEACAALDIATKKFPLAAKSRLRATRLQIIHERALHRGDIKTAQAACDSLSALLSPVQGVDIEHKIDVARRHAQTLLRAGQFAEAASAAHSLFNTCYENKMQLESIMTLLLLAEIHKKAGSFVSGLPYALASLTLSKTFNLDLVHALAIVTLAELWLGLGPTHAQRALALLQQCMTLVLGHGGRDLRARTYIAVARCHLSNPAYSVHANPQAVCEPLQAAAEELEALEDNELASEVYYLQARVFHALGAVQERDHAASLFQKFTLALRDAQTVETPSLP